MPLLDHFHAPLKNERHWESFHIVWASLIAQQLNQQLLAAEYFAEVHLSMSTEGLGTAVYVPPHPPLTLALDFSDLDVFEVRIRYSERFRLAAAIELVSPANKDRPSNRRAFAMKCASYLQHGTSVIVVDIVTERSAEMHTEILRLLSTNELPDADGVGSLLAVSYRTISSDGKVRLEAWPESLTVGASLPTLPMWLTAEFVVPVNLEQAYVATCESLRIRQK